MSEKTRLILPEMTVLDVISRYGETEKIFKGYDRIAGECICCHSLFDTLEYVAAKYGLCLSRLITELQTIPEDNRENI